MPKVEERRWKDGSVGYRVVYYVNGERNTYSDPDKSKVEAFAKIYDKSGADKALRLVREHEDEGPTLEESMRAHIRQLVGVGPGTLARYEKSIPQHFAELGQIRTQKLTQADVKEWIQDMLVKGLAPKTISNNHGFLAAALNTAVNHQVIPHNVTKGIRLPKKQVVSPQKQFLTREEFLEIREHIKPHYVPFFAFLLTTGLRFSEATALLVSDVKIKDGQPIVSVTKAWKEDGRGGYEIGGPKTIKGVRDVSFDAGIAKMIAPLLKNPKYLFTNTKGDVITSSLAHKVWGPACLAAGYTDENKPRIHALRHSHASNMLAKGMDMFELSHRLGHADARMTANVYSHLMPDVHFRGAEIAARAFWGIGEIEA